jgi:hypothetical protein
MTLQDLLSSRRGWPDEGTIYVVQPWSRDAEAVLSKEMPNSTDPVVRSGKRYDYFLEGFIARELLDDLGASELGVSREACERLIRYAIDSLSS